jgi:hypothetical protein
MYSKFVLPTKDGVFNIISSKQKRTTTSSCKSNSITSSTVSKAGGYSNRNANIYSAT